MIRVVFFGTAEISCPVLQTLHDMPEVELLGVVSQPDRPQGRKLKLLPTPVKAHAERLGLPVWQPDRLRKDTSFLEQLKSLDLDVAVVMAYGQLLPASLLYMPKSGCVNIHTSLLPKYRGAAPIQWAIWNGDTVTGVTLMAMDEGMDTGPILSSREVPVTDQTTAPRLHDQLAEEGAQLVREQLLDYVNGVLKPIPQPDEGSCHARKISKEDGWLDWTKPVSHLDCQIRALTPWPGCFTHHHTSEGKVERLKILEARPLDSEKGRDPGEIVQADREKLLVATGSGALEILKLQRSGGKVLNHDAFLAGCTLQKGDVLGADV